MTMPGFYDARGIRDISTTMTDIESGLRGIESSVNELQNDVRDIRQATSVIEPLATQQMTQLQPVLKLLVQCKPLLQAHACTKEPLSSVNIAVLNTIVTSIVDLTSGIRLYFSSLKSQRVTEGIPFQFIKHASDALEAIVQHLSSQQAPSSDESVERAAVHIVENVSKGLDSLREVVQDAQLLETALENSNVFSELMKKIRLNQQFEETAAQLQRLNQEKFKFMPFFVEGIVREKEAVFMDRFTQISATFQGHGDLFDDIAKAWNFFCTMSEADAHEKGVSELLALPQFRMFLEAPAGSGKTTIIKWIAREVEKLKNRHGNPLKCAVVVELLRLEEHFQSLGPTFEASISLANIVEQVLVMRDMVNYGGKMWYANGRDSAEILTSTQVMDGVVYILDGFDELPRAMSPLMKTFILALQTDTMQLLPFMRHVIVTSRPERMQSLESSALFTETRFVKMKLEPWSEKACTEYVRRFPWFTRRDVHQTTRAIANPSFDVFERRPFMVHLVCAALAHERRNQAYAWGYEHIGATISYQLSQHKVVDATRQDIDADGNSCVLAKGLDGQLSLVQPDGQTLKFVRRSSMVNNVKIVSPACTTQSSSVTQVEVDEVFQHLVWELTLGADEPHGVEIALSQELADDDTTVSAEDAMRKLDVLVDMGDSPSLVLERVIDHTLQWKALKNSLRVDSDCCSALHGDAKLKIEPLAQRQKERLAEIAFATVTSGSDDSRTLVTLTEADCLAGRVEQGDGKTVFGLDLERCGLFEAVVNRTTFKYKFLHKTIVEFLAARYIVNHLDSGASHHQELQLTESIVWFFVADLLRRKYNNIKWDSAANGLSLCVEEVMRCVAKKFTQLFREKEQEEGAELTQQALVAMEPTRRSRVADSCCVQAVLTFFYTVLPKTPPNQRDKNDPDGTRSAFRVLFEECNGMNFADRVAGWFKVSRPAWRYLFIEPAARVGALYVLQKVHTEGIDKTHMTWAALEATSTRGGERVVRHLLMEWGISVSIEDAVRLNHTGALKALLLASPDTAKIRSVKDWTPLLQEARGMHDKSALRILVEFLTTSPSVEHWTRGPSPSLLATMLDNLATATESAYLIATWSSTTAYWIATIPRPVHQVTSILWLIESAAMGVSAVTDCILHKHGEEVASLVRCALDFTRREGGSISEVAVLCIGWALSKCVTPTELRALTDRVRDVPLLILLPELLRRYVEWEKLRYFDVNPSQWRRRMETGFIPTLAEYAAQNLDDYAVGTVLSFMVGTTFFTNSQALPKLQLPLIKRSPLEGFICDGGSFECFEFAPDQPKLSVALSAVVNTLALPSIFSPPRHLRTLCGHNGNVNSASFSPDGRRIVTASDDKTAKVWDALSGKCLQTLSGHSFYVRSVVYSPDGRQIATSSSDKTVKIWDAINWKCLLTLSGHSDGDTVWFSAFSPDSCRIVTTSDDATAKIWDVKCGKLLQTLSGHSDCVFSAAYSPDGCQIVTGSHDGMAKVWDATGGTCLVALCGHSYFVRAVAYSPDGCHIVTSSDDATAKIWDVKSGKCLQTLSGHSDCVFSAAYSPDGSRIVTGSDDSTAKVWDATNGKCLQTLSGHGDCYVRAAAYSPDGRRIVTGSSDKQAKIWDATTASSGC